MVDNERQWGIFHAGTKLAAIIAPKYEKIYPDTWYAADCGIELFTGNLANAYLQNIVDDMYVETSIGIIRTAGTDGYYIFVRIDGLNYTGRFIFAGNLPALDINSSTYRYFCHRHYDLDRTRDIVGVKYEQLHKEFIDRIFSKYMILCVILLPDVANFVLKLMINPRLYAIMAP